MPRSGLCSVHCMEAKIHASLFNLIKKQYAMCRLKVCSNICVCVCVCLRVYVDCFIHVVAHTSTLVCIYVSTWIMFTCQCLLL